MCEINKDRENDEVYSKFAPILRLQILLLIA